MIDFTNLATRKKLIEVKAVVIIRTTQVGTLDDEILQP